jgi:hypothetical protein
MLLVNRSFTSLHVSFLHYARVLRFGITFIVEIMCVCISVFIVQSTGIDLISALTTLTCTCKMGQQIGACASCNIITAYTTRGTCTEAWLKFEGNTINRNAYSLIAHVNDNVICLAFLHKS